MNPATRALNSDSGLVAKESSQIMVNHLRPAVLIFGAASAALSGCASQSYGGLDPATTSVEVRDTLPEPDFAMPADQRGYRIGPFDQIRVSVFGLEELERSGTVDASGSFSMPLIGTLEVAGMTPTELSETVADRLRGRYVRDPQVTVNVTEIRSQRVTIDGAVAQPGVYPIVGRMSLVQAIATARGATEFAALEQVAVFRTANNQRMAALFSLRDIREGRYPDPEIYPNDVIVVGESGTRRILRDVLQALPALGVFTPLVRR